ncbi:MAG: hypothetical protein J0M29_12675 [Chitinophagales bacterium]|nr:hypothetical protein [Chitinophagales bacterium]
MMLTERGAYYQYYCSMLLKLPADNILHQTTWHLIYHEYETAFCQNQLSGEAFQVYAFYGDPVCALIGPGKDWGLVGGNVLVWFNLQNKMIQVLDAPAWVFRLRQEDEHTVHVLTDPWGEDPAIWLLKIGSGQEPEPAIRIRAFPDYVGLPFTDEVRW